MYYTENKIIIKSDPKKVYNILKDVTKWPEIFPPCRSVVVLKQEDNRIEMQITAITNKKKFTWKSERIYNDKIMTIFFKQLEPVKPLKSMYGEWRVSEIDNATLVLLTHRFDVEFLVLKGLVAFIIRKFFINSNSKRELSGIKTYIEGRENEV